MFMMTGPSNASVILDHHPSSSAVSSVPGNMPPPSTQSDDWAIRIGHGPAPDWARRNHFVPQDGTNEDPHEGVMRRTKQHQQHQQHQQQHQQQQLSFHAHAHAHQHHTNDPSAGGGMPGGGGGQHAMQVHALSFAHDPSPMTHHIDQIIQSIAEECQFLPGEVRMYYERIRDLDLTRTRFVRIRAMINEFP